MGHALRLLELNRIGFQDESSKKYLERERGLEHWIKAHGKGRKRDQGYCTIRLAKYNGLDGL